MSLFRDFPRVSELCIKQFRYVSNALPLRCGACLRRQQLTRRHYSMLRKAGSPVLNADRNALELERKHSSLLYPLLCLVNISARDYGIGTGEYEKLWAAATGGRGVGRGRKQKIKKGVEEGVLHFGKAKISWPGLTEPIVLEEGKGEQLDKPFEYRQLTGIPLMHSGTPRYGQFISPERGWAGGSLAGKHAGPPQMPTGEILEGFDSIIIEVRRVAAQTKRGRRRSYRALVACGNGNGAVGWAIGNSLQAKSAIWKARNKAGNYIHNLKICDGHTIYHDLSGSYHKTKIRMERKQPGNGLKCQRIIKAIAELAGYKDLYCRIVGRCTTPISVVRATFSCFLSQETHDELAERTGKHVVEFRPEMGNRPIVVASPSDDAIARRIKLESQGDEEDELAQTFDPMKGLHRAKKMRQRKRGVLRR